MMTSVEFQFPLLLSDVLHNTRLARDCVSTYRSTRQR